MTQRRKSNSPAHGRALARPRPQGWRAAVADEIRMIDASLSTRISRGFEWFLELGMPTAAQILEMQNVKRRIPEIGEIDQAVRALLEKRASPSPPSRAVDERPMPFAD
jgi:hypothetical protein